MVMKKKVLFLCTGNSCRSQMAEGLLRHFAGNKYEVFSAGINPTEVNPMAIEVMQKMEIDISKQRSKSIDEFKDYSFDYVITVCDNAKESCPYFSGSHMLHWDIEDPADNKGTSKEMLIVFRKTRNLIEKLLHKLFLVQS